MKNVYLKVPVVLRHIIWNGNCGSRNAYVCVFIYTTLIVTSTAGFIGKPNMVYKYLKFNSNLKSECDYSKAYIPTE